jgi:hypothetical protein
MAAPRPAITDSHPIWVHLITLAAVASGGVLFAVAIGLSAIPWPETIAVCIWFSVLCVLTAMALSSRPARPI